VKIIFYLHDQGEELIFCSYRVFQEILYGISTGFGSPQVPVAEILARAVPSLHSPQKPKSSNFLQVPDIETPR
jgi:RAP1 GTPase activating protein 1